MLGEDEGVYKLRVTFLVDDFDEGVLSYSECEQVMTMLYEAYNDYNISFLWDRKIDNYYSSADDLYHAININVTKGGFTGKAVPGTETAIAISKKVLFTPALVHEMGHCLGLLHTHNSADDDVSTKTFNCEEFVFPSDSDNCIKCGDCICETNAITSSEPFVTEDEDGNCVYGSNAMDSQDVLYEPNEKTLHNFMSYSRNINLGVDCREIGL